MTSLMYDSAPGQFPPGAVTVALYANGLYAFPRNLLHAAWTRILWIDVLGTDPAGASILDIETGDATVSEVTDWCAKRVAAVPGTLLRLYCNISTWPAVREVVGEMAPDLRARVRYWIANPTGTAHLVPGSAATQWEWGNSWDTSTYGPAW